MALFGLGSALSQPLVLRGEGLVLRLAEMRDYEAWARLRRDSRAFLAPWEPLWPDDDLTRSAFRRRVRRQVHEAEIDEALAFLIFRESDQALVGGLTLGHIRRGVAQTATLGYWMGTPYARQGFMTRAVRVALLHAFGVMRLHRIEAACLPHNEASKRLLVASGFSQEGLARGYLRIAGQWQDHLLFARLNSAG